MGAGAGVRGAVAVVVAVAAAPALADWPSLPYDAPEVTTEVEARQARIEAELRTLRGHPWAGVYTSGDGYSSAYLAVSPGAGYVFTFDGCMGLYGRNHGAVASTPSGLELLPVLSSDDAGMAPPSELLHVTWGQRSYLVYPEDVVHFCNGVNAGGGNAHVGGALLRKGDERWRARGKPMANGSPLPCLLEAPIRARIVAVRLASTQPTENGTERFFELTVNAGQAEGAFPGMIFTVEDPGANDWFEVIEVDDHVSRGVSHHADLDARPDPVTGWRVTTRSAPDPLPRSR